MSCSPPPLTRLPPHPVQLDKIRGRFEANKGLSDPLQIERALEKGEAELREHLHPDPYIVPYRPGELRKEAERGSGCPAKQNRRMLRSMPRGWDPLGGGT